MLCASNERDGFIVDRIAIISDIHGNIPALDEVLSDIKKRGINRIMCLGDIAGKGPDSDLAVDVVKKNCEAAVKGNWDFLITEYKDSKVLDWHRNKLGENRLEYLKKLPLYVEFYISGRLIRLCHAAPYDVFHRVPVIAAVEDKLELFSFPGEDKKEADIIGYGDIHGAYVQNFKGKTIFNSGSVGNPLEGITQASYAIIEGEFGSEKVSSFSINLVRLPYDIEKSIEAAEKSKMPDLKEYIDELTTAKYRGLKPLK